ncbi:hypothetical protein [Paenibacillus mendelii]|uniref:DUF4390 domain-containing protein n=1 Tax=Paenibacillus mendelii TaxID=206163 RepID=A0ABV6JGW9_9BACL|nr:hypothetical protein [Paenibacillus mendelii]MCQ6558039.1 hypothetical protein [Paenibacillus mendelii]
MHIGKRFLASAAVAALAAALLLLIPLGNPRTDRDRDELAVFHSAPITRISYDNLVDSMIGLRLSLPIRKVDWKQAVLSLDLSVEGRTEDSQGWMADLERLLYLAFVQTDNVNRVLVRFVADADPQFASQKTSLYAAVDVRRSDTWIETDLSALDSAQPRTDSLWRQRLRMTFTPLGGQVSGQAD